MRSFKENKKDINRFILQQKEGNRLKPRTVKKGFLGVMGLFLVCTDSGADSVCR